MLSVDYVAGRKNGISDFGIRSGKNIEVERQKLLQESENIHLELASDEKQRENLSNQLLHGKLTLKPEQDLSPPSCRHESEGQLDTVLKYLKSQKKTKTAAETLIAYFSQFRFFKQIMNQLSDKLLKQIVFELHLQTLHKQQVIFNQGDVGGNMYFVLSGKVAILIPSTSPQSPKKEPTFKEKQQSQQSQQYQAQKSDQQMQKNQSFSSQFQQIQSPQSNSNRQSFQTSRNISSSHKISSNNTPRILINSPRCSIISPKTALPTPQIMIKRSSFTNSPRKESPASQGDHFSFSPQFKDKKGSIQSSSSHPSPRTNGQQSTSSAFFADPSNPSINSFRDFLLKSFEINQPESLSSEEEFEYFRLWKHSNLKQVNTICEGNTFGEVALEQRIPRTASAITITDCQLATLSYDGFRKLLSTICERLQDEQRGFLKQIPPMSRFPNFGVMVIYNNCEEIELQIGNVIYKEKDPLNFIYFLREGEVDILKRFEIDQFDTTALQKRKVIVKKEVILKIAEGRMFGEFEASQYYLAGRRQDVVGLSLRETEAVCKTKVRMMRMNARQFFLNFIAFQDPSQKDFFALRYQTIMEKINKIRDQIIQIEKKKQEDIELNTINEILLAENNNINNSFNQVLEPVYNKRRAASHILPQQQYNQGDAIVSQRYSAQLEVSSQQHLKNLLNTSYDDQVNSCAGIQTVSLRSLNMMNFESYVSNKESMKKLSSQCNSHRDIQQMNQEKTPQKISNSQDDSKTGRSLRTLVAQMITKSEFKSHTHSVRSSLTVLPSHGIADMFNQPISENQEQEKSQELIQFDKDHGSFSKDHTKSNIFDIPSQKMEKEQLRSQQKSIVFKSQQEYQMQQGYNSRILHRNTSQPILRNHNKSNSNNRSNSRNQDKSDIVIMNLQPDENIQQLQNKQKYKQTIEDNIKILTKRNSVQKQSSQDELLINHPLKIYQPQDLRRFKVMKRDLEERYKRLGSSESGGGYRTSKTQWLPRDFQNAALSSLIDSFSKKGDNNLQGGREISPNQKDEDDPPAIQDFELESLNEFQLNNSQNERIVSTITPLKSRQQSSRSHVSLFNLKKQTKRLNSSDPPDENIEQAKQQGEKETKDEGQQSQDTTSKSKIRPLSTPIGKRVQQYSSKSSTREFSGSSKILDTKFTASPESLLTLKTTSRPSSHKPTSWAQQSSKPSPLKSVLRGSTNNLRKSEDNLYKFELVKQLEEQQKSQKNQTFLRDQQYSHNNNNLELSLTNPTSMNILHYTSLITPPPSYKPVNNFQKIDPSSQDNPKLMNKPPVQKQQLLYNQLIDCQRNEQLLSNSQLQAQQQYSQQLKSQQGQVQQQEINLNKTNPSSQLHFNFQKNQQLKHQLNMGMFPTKTPTDEFLSAAFKQKQTPFFHNNIVNQLHYSNTQHIQEQLPKQSLELIKSISNFKNPTIISTRQTNPSSNLLSLHHQQQEVNNNLTSRASALRRSCHEFSTMEFTNKTISSKGIIRKPSEQDLQTFKDGSKNLKSASILQLQSCNNNNKV